MAQEATRLPSCQLGKEVLFPSCSSLARTSFELCVCDILLLLPCQAWLWCATHSTHSCPVLPLSWNRSPGACGAGLRILGQMCFTSLSDLWR